MLSQLRKKILEKLNLFIITLNSSSPKYGFKSQRRCCILRFPFIRSLVDRKKWESHIKPLWNLTILLRGYGTIIVKPPHYVQTSDYIRKTGSFTKLSTQLGTSLGLYFICIKKIDLTKTWYSLFFNKIRFRKLKWKPHQNEIDKIQGISLFGSWWCKSGTFTHLTCSFGSSNKNLSPSIKFGLSIYSIHSKYTSITVFPYKTFYEKFR